MSDAYQEFLGLMAEQAAKYPHLGFEVGRDDQGVHVHVWTKTSLQYHLRQLFSDHEFKWVIHLRDFTETWVRNANNRLRDDIWKDLVHQWAQTKNSVTELRRLPNGEWSQA